MPYPGAQRRRWDIPFGSFGIGAMAIVGGFAFTFGEFAFYGFQFLPYWPRIGGWFLGLGVFAAATGTLIEGLIWKGAAERRPRLLASWPALQRGLLAAGILVALAVACWFAHPHYRCLLVGAPVVGVLVFFLATSLQQPILLALREAKRPAAALAGLLVLEATTMFLVGEWMAIGDYKKGLTHFQKEHRAEWSISTSGSADFYIDYERQEIVLRTRVGARNPFEIRRSFAGTICR